MRCRICETELPSDASCCYRCGTFVDDTIRQVEPLPASDTEQTTRVRPRQATAPPEPQAVTANSQPLSTVTLLVLAIVGIVLGIIGLVAYFSQRGDVARSETPNQTTSATLPSQQANVPTPTANRTATPKTTQTPDSRANEEAIQPLPDSPVINANRRMQTQPTEGKRQVARELLKRDMLQEAARQAKKSHPASNLEGCSQQVTQTLAADTEEEWFGVYKCRLRGAIFGRDAFETQVSVAGTINWQNDQFIRNVGNVRVTSDRKVR